MIPDLNYPQWHCGDRVDHDEYGEGFFDHTVDGSSAAVMFDDEHEFLVVRLDALTRLD